MEILDMLSEDADLAMEDIKLRDVQNVLEDDIEASSFRGICFLDFVIASRIESILTYVFQSSIPDSCVLL